MKDDKDLMEPEIHPAEDPKDCGFYETGNTRPPKNHHKLVAVLLVVSLFIMSNTIKLTTFDRKEEIAIMKMVGATDGFIRWPFVYEGLLLGLFSAVVAFFLQWGLYAGISAGIGASETLQLLDILPFTVLWGPVLVIFIIVGLLVGVAGSLMAIRKFLRV